MLNEAEPVFLSIVIPAYNEEERIAKSLNEISGYLQKKEYTYEIIVVDDGSLDSTGDLVSSISRNNGNIRVLRNDVNRGKGYSVKRGVLASTGEYVLFLDADLPVPIEEVESLLEWLRSGYEIAIGSKRLRDSKSLIEQPLYRRLMGRIFNILLQLFIIRGIKDTQCGFKCFRREAADMIFPKQLIEGFCFDVELLYLAKKWGISIKETPVKWTNRDTETTVRILRDSIRMFLDLFKIRINYWMGKYR
jgi:dolichyl-phosphate beta-glucosyltransferase